MRPQRAVRRQPSCTSAPGETWDGAARRWVGERGFDMALTTAWAEAGARFIGGCCRVGPSAIAAMVRVLS
ncbi:homocysteine S-methyltransferase family protein [Microbacterium sp. Root166]|uniref:homocysteine S-methyltransferase family protein n=1 Tax=Microbacterium sp. Root166 TaxID=1736478 RepID=UPI0009E820FE|nr:homocysteine S-methyltransferase family protein [Microbacterium sp. Root166]